MRIVIAPDKFKGSLPAKEVAAAIAAGLRAGLRARPAGPAPERPAAERPAAERPGPELVTIPVADGGDGTADAAVAADGSASTDGKLRDRTTAGEATAPAGQLLTRMGS
jgi:glycerate kinase